MLGLLIPMVVVGAAIGMSVPLGRYMRWAMDPVTPGPRRRRFEALIPRVLGERAAGEQRWRGYLVSMLLFNLVMFSVAYLVLVTQRWLPLNPDRIGNMEPSLAFNTAASFTSNTNLQHYAGETGLSYFSQLFPIMWLQFVSAATGIAALAALCRGLAGREQLGNFFADVWRGTVLILLPLSFPVAAFFVLAGMPMTFEGAAAAHTLEGLTQTIARGPVAAMVAIKQLGTNGGGFFGPNCTHPFENPGFWASIVANVAIPLVPMACVWMFGHIVGRRRDAVVIFVTMLMIYAGFLAIAVPTERAPTRAFAGLPVAPAMNLEGKELRLGPSAGATWGVSTTVTSNGSVAAMHDSFNPLTGLVAMMGMWLNCAFGGVGVGVINLFIYIIVGVFIAGLMVGRTPEYLTKKVEAREMKLALIALLVHPLFILGGTAWFAATPWGVDTVANPGSHGLSEILYEFSSAAANNGSSFAGLRNNTVPWNVATGVVMLLGRFIPIITPLAIAASLAAKKPAPETSGTFRTDGPLFGAVLLGTVLIVGALLFMPIAVLGPVAEHLTPGGDPLWR